MESIEINESFGKNDSKNIDSNPSTAIVSVYFTTFQCFKAMTY